jgi:hypothetical protein
MDGRMVPQGIMLIDPWYLNFFNNMATVQFDHRAIAWVLALTVPCSIGGCAHRRMYRLRRGAV